MPTSGSYLLGCFRSVGVRLIGRGRASSNGRAVSTAPRTEPEAGVFVSELISSPRAGRLCVPTSNCVYCYPFGLPREFSSFVAWLVPRCFAGVPLLNVLKEGRREVLAAWRKCARPVMGCQQSADDLAANE